MSSEETTQRLETTTSTMLGRYKLLRKLGQGGMGEVWLAEDPRLHRQVAIKTLPVHSQNDREFLQRFEREARAAAALNHPHILSVHDYGEQKLAEGQAVTYIVMPYVPGGTLGNRLTALVTSHKLMPAEEILSSLSQAAEAIDYAHGQQVLHRDIKPGNMLLRDDNWLLLADFGIARVLSSDQEHLTQAGIGIGTPEYMAPEQAQGRPEPASDTYSLAVIAYQMFTGQLPFHAETPYATTIQHITTPPPPPRQVNPNISIAVERALLHGLAKEPGQRPTTAQAFVEELRGALNEQVVEDTYPGLSEEAMPTLITASNTPTVITDPVLAPGNTVMSSADSQPSAKGVSRRQVLIGGGAVVLLAAGGAGAWALTSRKAPTVITKPTPAPIDPNAPIMTLIGHTQPVSSLVWSPASVGVLVSTSRDHQVLLWDIKGMLNGQEDRGKPKADQAFPLAGNLLAAWSPDGSSIAIGNSRETINAKDPNVIDTLADIYQSDLSKRIDGFNEKYMTYYRTTYMMAMAWAPGKYLVSVSHPHETTSSRLFLLEFRDPLHPGVSLASIHVPNFGYAIANSPDQVRQAIGIDVGVAVGQLDRSGGNITWKVEAFLPFVKGQTFPAGDVSWSPDGKYVAAVNLSLFVGKFMPSSLLSIWDWASGTQIPLTLPGDKTILTKVAWCPAASSTLLAAGARDGNVYLWNSNPQTGSGNALPVRTLKGIGAEVTALAWSIDGRWLAAGFKDTRDSILIWKL